MDVAARQSPPGRQHAREAEIFPEAPKFAQLARLRFRSIASSVQATSARRVAARFMRRRFAIGHGMVNDEQVRRDAAGHR